jgi:hypothetical protein
MTEQPGGTECGQSTVSALCQRRDPLVTAWNTRPLPQPRDPFLLGTPASCAAGKAPRCRAGRAPSPPGCMRRATGRCAGGAAGPGSPRRPRRRSSRGSRTGASTGCTGSSPTTHRGWVHAVSRPCQGATEQRGQTRTPGGTSWTRRPKPTGRAPCRRPRDLRGLGPGESPQLVGCGTDGGGGPGTPDGAGAHGRFGGGHRRSGLARAVPAAPPDDARPGTAPRSDPPTGAGHPDVPEPGRRDAAPGSAAPRDPRAGDDRDAVSRQG